MAVRSTTDTADRRFVRTAMNKPMLSQEHEVDLAVRWRDNQDEDALHELTSAYMRLVISMASKFRHYGLPLSDLVQEGNVGLMLAAARFDPDREVRFSTYASWWIRSSIQDFVLRNWSIVRTGTTAAQKSLFFNLKRLRAKIDDTGDGVMTPENKTWIATHLGVPERDVENMASRLSASDRSLNAPLATDSEAQWQDLLEDENEVTEVRVMEMHDSERRRKWIVEALKTLTDRENLIIRERRFTDDTVTLEVLGKQLGISKERVRQIEHQALGKLRKALVSMVGDPEETGLIPIR
ncbi:MAG: RNA polymerase factor sigma-32 [Henriciella sp.]|jgi:RNA polymerase sigma-32 factor|uniref:RNA polymerase factor sigma-32 n=1 Tax=Henriciella sp. TaxID=1968823 RepID=UPI000C0E6B3E|nr:RNA polymerase factor sigma-32 [Henriciella sp.]MAN74948.1 RNA polymerase factor sigma-32 [Henriciella sp.]MBF33855.1 RNA polymerase factor sigma-32 [Hyphomonadaceae bacterium]PHR79739.1 MAG: RNA polymerase factor sigma-32 [Henriciella sp.]|tara:strand:- start:3637 stop:4521 length:885 start_codon:yes stop_codon:yes gene_type:complete